MNDIFEKAYEAHVCPAFYITVRSSKVSQWIKTQSITNVQCPIQSALTKNVRIFSSMENYLSVFRLSLYIETLASWKKQAKKSQGAVKSRQRKTISGNAGYNTGKQSSYHTQVTLNRILKPRLVVRRSPHRAFTTEVLLTEMHNRGRSTQRFQRNAALIAAPILLILCINNQLSYDVQQFLVGISQHCLQREQKN